jgi:hypothetical protein
VPQHPPFVVARLHCAPYARDALTPGFRAKCQEQQSIFGRRPIYPRFMLLRVRCRLLAGFGFGHYEA